MRHRIVAGAVVAGLLLAGAAWAGEVRLNAVVVSVKTDQAQNGTQVRTLTINIPEKNDTLTFTILPSDKENFTKSGDLKPGDKIVVALITGDGKPRLREFSKPK